jgi:hypothetical protein
VKFKLHHGYRVGQIIREGKHFRKVIKVVGPWYDVMPYCINAPLYIRPGAWADKLVDNALRLQDIEIR